MELDRGDGAKNKMKFWLLNIESAPDVWMDAHGCCLFSCVHAWARAGRTLLALLASRDHLRFAPPNVACATGARTPWLPTCILYATRDLLLKHSYATLVTYKKRQMKPLKHVSKTLAKTVKKHCKHIQHPDKTLATYVRNICNIQINTLATYV
jgi:hypothetical protein